MVPLAAFDEAQACECGEGARRLISAPRVLSDQIEAVRGADGKMHDSLSGLRASYLPSGNPQGERYLELGDQNITPTEHKVDRRQRRNDIKAAMEDVRNGRVAPIPPAPPGM
jgi:hypothetical protein